MKQPTIQRILEFHKLLNSFAEIERVVHIKRRDDIMLESDTEHSYNLAMTAWFVADYFPELDKAKIVQLALVHDLVEIHAGDTFAFADQALLDSKAAREAVAAKQLKEEWGDFLSLHETIAEYESLKTPEACFTYAFDKLMPMLTVYLNDGLTWHEKELTLERMNTEKRSKMTVAPNVLQYWDDMHQLLLQSPHLFPK